jgi:hypothetical protein
MEKRRNTLQRSQDLRQRSERLRQKVTHLCARTLTSIFRSQWALAESRKMCGKHS